MPRILASTRGPLSVADVDPTAAARSNATLALGLLNGIATDMTAHAPDAAKSFATQQTSHRQRLDHIGGTPGSSDEMTHARGQLLATTMDAAVTLYRATGSRAAIASSTAARRLREAAFVQIAATSRDERDTADQ
ncbi:hypothetical protein [Gordonia zhaorongruii]|uniref:hypothetical protein n=1 Tax=Gordonia zhaorongruii TaxID=2597659 RepID=UPI00117C4B31|nr:hypothetical protein [Gordonia zhaorongruii]